MIIGIGKQRIETKNAAEQKRKTEKMMKSAGTVKKEKLFWKNVRTARIILFWKKEKAEWKTARTVGMFWKK